MINQVFLTGEKLMICYQCIENRLIKFSLKSIVNIYACIFNYSQLRSHVIKAHREVNALYVFRQCATRNIVHARLCVFS